MESFSTEAAVLKHVPRNCFLENAEVLGQHLKSLFWKILSYYIRQPIKITSRFCKLSSLDFAFCFLCLT